MMVNKKNRTAVGFVSMALGLILMAGGAFLGGEEYLTGLVKGAAVTASVGSGTVLAFGVGRRLLSSDEESSEGQEPAPTDARSGPPV